MSPGDVYALPVHPAADLFPMLPSEELTDLASDIAKHGMHEPIWLYEDPERGWVLLDGRNRRSACEMASIDQPTWRRYTGDDPIGFVVSENVHRRHLTAGQKAAVACEVLPMYEAEAAKRQKEAAARGGASSPRKVTADRQEPSLEQEPPTPAPAPRAPTAAKNAARSTGSSERSVARYKRVEEAAPDLAERVKAGELALDRAERIIRDRDAEAKRIAEAKAEAEAQPVSTSVDIREGDFREVLSDLTDIDAIITDPPYPAEFLPLLGDLAVWADKVLSPDGVLAVLIGQTHLPEVYRLLSGFRTYRWTACYLTDGPGYVSHARRVQSNWKPLIVYGGGNRFSDVVRSTGSDAQAKDLHKWGQDYSAFHTIIDRLTSKGQTVVDPFMGSGTTLLAAHALGRHAIGADLDPEHVATSRERLA